MNDASPRRALGGEPVFSFLALAVLAVFGWAGWWVFGAWEYDRTLRRAESDFDQRRFTDAQKRLAWLSARWPGREEVEYTLGQCEAAPGTSTPHSRPGPGCRGRRRWLPAALDRARFAIQHGRLADAELSLGGLAGASGEIDEEAARLADQVDLFSGRFYRIGPRIERRWKTARNQAALLRAHAGIDTEPFPSAQVGQELRRMSAESPDDHRVWLGLADLALRDGRRDEADAILTRCEARQPDDPDVLRLRLLWASTPAGSRWPRPWPGASSWERSLRPKPTCWPPAWPS